jgi:hypothetical protein
MAVAVDLLSGFVECLLLVLALHAVRRGRALYWVAAVGMALVLYGRVAAGFLVGDLSLLSLRITATAFLTLIGLAVAALTVLADLLFEVVEDPEQRPRPSV